MLELGQMVLRRVYAYSVPSARRALLGLCREIRMQILGDLNIWKTFGTEPLPNNSVVLTKGGSGFLRLVMTIRAHERQTLFPLLNAERLAKLEKIELHIYSSTYTRVTTRVDCLNRMDHQPYLRRTLLFEWLTVKDDGITQFPRRISTNVASSSSILFGEF